MFNFFFWQVNDIAFHPIHNTVATVGSDGTYSFWDKDSRIKLASSEQQEQSITRCCFNHNGQIFAYAVSYDWSKVDYKLFPPLFVCLVQQGSEISDWFQGHEYYNPQKKNSIFLHPCFEDMKPRSKTSS